MDDSIWFLPRLHANHFQRGVSATIGKRGVSVSGMGKLYATAANDGRADVAPFPSPTPSARNPRAGNSVMR